MFWHTIGTGTRMANNCVICSWLYWRVLDAFSSRWTRRWNVIRSYRSKCLHIFLLHGPCRISFAGKCKLSPPIVKFQYRLIRFCQHSAKDGTGRESSQSRHDKRSAQIITTNRKKKNNRDITNAIENFYSTENAKDVVNVGSEEIPDIAEHEIRAE